MNKCQQMVKWLERVLNGVVMNPSGSCILLSIDFILISGWFPIHIIGVCWTPVGSIRPSYVIPNFGNTFLDFVTSIYVTSWLWCKNLNITEKTSQKWCHAETLSLETLLFSEHPFNYQSEKKLHTDFCCQIFSIQFQNSWDQIQI